VLNDLYSSPYIVWVIKSRIMRWAGHVAHIGVRRNVYRVLVGKPEGTRPLGRPRHRWEFHIRMDLQEVGCGCIGWIDLAQLHLAAIKVKVKLSLCVPWRHMWERKYSCTHFLNLTLLWGEWSALCFCCLSYTKHPLILTEERQGGLQNQSGVELKGENSFLSWKLIHNYWVVQCVA
jgi:hypothetical protein